MNARQQLATILAAAVTLLLAAGCETVHYELHPPRTDAGKACVTQCAVVREICRGNELRRTRMSIDACERRTDSAVRVCLVDATDAERKKMCELSRPPCWVADEVAHCEFAYRACFVQCGGSVDKVIETR